MRPFNCLSADCPIFGPHLLEASAGTGKTFSIEHVVVRLLLQSEEIDIEEILAVTFTRAATRDLKKRIRANISEAFFRIQTEKKGWEYLDPHLGSEKAARKLNEASLAFDRCQIFTIHGFCHRMLQEFAFEADLGFSLRDPDREALVPKRLYREAKKFIESGIGPDLICPEQMVFLLKDVESQDKFIETLLKKKTNQAALPFASLVDRYASLVLPEGIEEGNLFEAFHKIQSGYKTEVKGDFESQIRALERRREDPADSLRQLIQEQGSLFEFLDPKNKKVKTKVECPEFFRWASQNIGPIVQEAIDRKKILGCLQKAWKEIEDPILFEEQWFEPDEILKRMRSALEKESFASAVRKKYKAVIVDEFQDTDPLQWEIFKILFLQNRKPLKAFYLVGDPKQSIYRFRNADIYTYLEARNLLGPSALFCLDTNYRSSSKMIEALNALFDRNWLALPKLGETLSCPSVKSCSEISSDFSDGKGAVHFISGHSYEESFLPHAISEIERLLPILNSLSSFAILVKDRYQAEIALTHLQQRSIPAVAKSHVPLGKTLAFQSIRELFEALAFSKDTSLERTIALGPLGAFSLSEGRSLLEEKGFISLCRHILHSASSDLEFQLDLKQVIEELLAWEGRYGFSFEELIRFLDEFEHLEADEGGRRRIETDADAVQILTLHVSKGLEFDVVFALGLATRPPEVEEAAEADAEKLRQLYVAMTRAKRRLYVPIANVAASRGSLSPMELFSQTIDAQEGSFLSFLEKLEGVTCETLPEQVTLPSCIFQRETQKPAPSLSFRPTVFPCFLHSFTSLSQPKTKELAQKDEASQTALIYNAHTIPKGVETGILIHQIFELLFSSPTPIWKERSSVESLVSQELKGTSLFSWEASIREMVWKTLNLPLSLEKPFSLVDLLPGQFFVEMEFLFSKPPHFIKGFIDLVFTFEGKFYFLDWKTNWLGSDDSAYLSLNSAMTEHDYWLQAKLYAEALRRHVKRFYIQPFDEIFGGAVYLFLRGSGVCYFKPDLNDD